MASEPMAFWLNRCTLSLRCANANSISRRRQQKTENRKLGFKTLNLSGQCNYPTNKPCITMHNLTEKGKLSSLTTCDHYITCSNSSVYLQHKAAGRSIIRGGGGYIHIFVSAQLISFEIEIYILKSIVFKVCEQECMNISIFRRPCNKCSPQDNSLTP